MKVHPDDAIIMSWGIGVLRAGLLTAAIDGLFSSVLSVAFYHSTVTRLFQGVASTLLGPDSFSGGVRTAAVGVMMHIRRAVATRAGIVGIAAVYGPFVWLFMSLLVIPLLVRRPPSITVRWWIQLVGHFPFVGLPIVASLASVVRRAREVRG